MPTETRSVRAPSLDPALRRHIDGVWKRAYAARGKDDLQDLYADWARTYERDHAAIGYFGHVRAAEALQRHLPPRDDLAVLDAGAGTGLAGAELATRGYTHLTAIDLSAPMLTVARRKGVYEELAVVDLSLPIDRLSADRFGGAVLVGVFSFGQAPAHALDEILRVVEPGGVIVFTMRTDFHASDAMGVASRMAELESEGAWEKLEVTEPMPYLPGKDPEARFRVWTYRVLPGKRPEVPADFVAAVDAAFSDPGPVKALAHHHIWDATGSRLYDAYIQRPEYYLNEREEQILRENAGDFLGDHALCVELGCGSAKKISHVFEAVLAGGDGDALEYMPIDLSPGALATTAAQIEEQFGDRVKVDPRLGHFDDTLASIPAERAKAVFFLGGSIGNFETVEDTVGFLAMVRERLTPRDRFVVGFDLAKDAHVFEQAYNAGEPNRLFFVHMLRRMNHLLGTAFDLDAFRLGSTCDPDPAAAGLDCRRVSLKVVSERDQTTACPALGRDLSLKAGDAVEVGISRKFATDDIAELASRAGLRVRTLWFDSLHEFALGEMVRDDAPTA